MYLYFGLVAATAGLDSDKLAAMASVQLQETSTIFIEDTSNLTTLCWLILFNNLIDLFQITIQTFLLILAEQGCDSKIKWKSGQRWKSHLLKEILWFLCVCNFCKWGSESFLEDYILKNSEPKSLVFTMSKRTAITQSTYPLVLFYRFHSAIMMLAVQGTRF